MERKKVRDVQEILDEIESLEKYEKFLKDSSYGKSVHFEILLHYGDCKYDNEKIIIKARHTPRLLGEVNKIIQELEEKLSSL